MSARERGLRLAHPAVVLLGLAILAYGILLPQMGFYWDEVPMSWIRYELGPEAMTRYFSTNRPVWGLLYQLTTSLLPQIPIYWQVFALLLRLCSGLLVWLLAINLFPGRRELALTAAGAFLLYPGFTQQWTSYLYSHFFLVLCFLLLSFLCSILAVKIHARKSALTAAGILLSALNLWMLEYFYILELLRPLLILQADLAHRREGLSQHAVMRTARRWAPYLLVFAANVLWRQLVFNNQIYQPTLLRSLATTPLAEAANILRTLATQIYRVGVEAWIGILRFPSLVHDGPRTVVYYAAVVGLSVGLLGLALLAARRGSQGAARATWIPIGIGLAGMILAAGPFLLTGLEVTLAHPANRFTLPFMLGAALVFAGSLAFLPSRTRIWVTIIALGLASGRQALEAEKYRHDWATHRAMFWQMLWRAPGIEPDTIVLLNEGALPYDADNSLTGSLNWIYDPRDRSPTMDYVLFFPTSRVGGSLPALLPNLPINYDFIAEDFQGSTSQVLAFDFRPPRCLRLLDPTLDAENRLIPDSSMMRQAAMLSSTEWILAEDGARMPQIYGPEPSHGWCYFFQRADLAAQMGDWPAVVELGNEAFKLDDYPNDPVERFVFIEGYARTGDWQRALDLSIESHEVSPRYVDPLLCKLWDRIGAGSPAGPEAQETVAEVRNLFACASE